MMIALAVSTLGLTVGDMEAGPDVVLKLSSGSLARFATWVNVTEKRVFEAVWNLDSSPTDVSQVEADVREAQVLLRRQASERKADAMIVSVLWDRPDGPGAVTCYFENPHSLGRCLLTP